MLALAAVALSVGAAAWIADVDASAPFVTAALTPTGVESSFEDRFRSLSSAEAGPRLADRSAMGVLQFKLRDAKALLARQLLDDDWRSTLADNEEPAADEARPVHKTDIPLPRSRPAQADLAAQIASSQAYADTLPRTDSRADSRSWLDKFKITLASLTPDSGLLRNSPDLAALGYDSQTAVYDISARAVYLPSGVALEAHSGMGSLKDDPAHVHEPNVGATPPAVYDLKPRERLFHGVRALRLTPAEGSSALGRVGLLTHSYLLGPGGDSNGCVSIKNYDRFIKAYDNGEFSRLVVVPSLSGTASASQRSTSDS